MLLVTGPGVTGVARAAARSLPASGHLLYTDAVSRIVLIHWKPAEAGSQADPLRAAGLDVEVLRPDGNAGLRPFAESPPSAFVIDLSRIPSQGKAVGIALRQQKATRLVPLVFAGGDPVKVRGVRTLLPDAGFCERTDIAETVRASIAAPPPAPVVPGTMDGYSGTPLPRKLGIREDTVVAALGAPAGILRHLPAEDGRAGVRRRARGRADLVLLFVRSARELRRRFPSAARMIQGKGGIWIAWRKKTSGIATDLTEPAVRRFGLDAGWVDYKVCAIDAVWSGLLFAPRKKSARLLK
jgi:hypothetical protein